MKRVRIVAVVFLLVLPFLAWAAGGTETGTTTTGGAHPATWIADRLIKGRIFLENDGENLPTDQINNPVAKKIKELTGVTLQWQSTGASNGLEELTLALAAQDIPEIIESYLDHSGRPEMSVILKAAREGMFTNIRPYLEKTKIYSKYITDPNFAPKDSINNVMMRPEFNGAIYVVHMNVPASDRRDSDRTHSRGGLWLREDIATALGIKGNEIKTQDDLFNLLVKIKNGGFKDANGKSVIPMGPRYWGGYYMSTVVRNYDFGNGTRFDVDKDGKIKHVMETDYAWKQVQFYRKLVAENLLQDEFFTMDDVRTREGATNGSWAMMPWFGVATTNRELKSPNYVPISMANWKGETAYYEAKRGAYNTWAIFSKAKNPDEIVRFADFLASKEGKALWNYGIEGVDYTVTNGKYVFTKDYMDFSNANPAKIKDRIPNFWGWLLGSTWNNNVRDFNELWVGLNSATPGSDVDKYNKRALYEMAYGNPTYKYWEGFSAVAYLSDLPEL